MLTTEWGLQKKDFQLYVTLVCCLQMILDWTSVNYLFGKEFQMSKNDCLKQKDHEKVGNKIR